MANTNALKTRVEPYVRAWLEERYAQPFRSEFLSLAGCSGRHEFDAVSADRRVVGAIKCSSGRTSGGRGSSGKVAGLFQELYFLASVEAEKRLVVLTNREFFEIAQSRTKDKLSRNIEILHCPLSAELEIVVAEVCREASDEMDRGKVQVRTRTAGA